MILRSQARVDMEGRAPNLLELVPERSADWEERADRIVLLRPRPSASGPRRLFDWLAYQLAAKRLRLDEVGTFSWRRMDGRRTVHQIASDLRREFGAQVEPAEERLGRFVQQLQREELVRFPELEGGPR